jgi:hypothetical protein
LYLTGRFSFEIFGAQQKEAKHHFSKATILGSMSFFPQS